MEIFSFNDVPHLSIYIEKDLQIARKNLKMDD